MKAQHNRMSNVEEQILRMMRVHPQRSANYYAERIESLTPCYFFRVLQRLYKRGLITKTTNKNGERWRVTPNGKRALDAVGVMT